MGDGYDFKKLFFQSINSKKNVLFMFKNPIFKGRFNFPPTLHDEENIYDLCFRGILHFDGKSFDR